MNGSINVLHASTPGTSFESLPPSVHALLLTLQRTFVSRASVAAVSFKVSSGAVSRNDKGGEFQLRAKIPDRGPWKRQYDSRRFNSKRGPWKRQYDFCTFGCPCCTTGDQAWSQDWRRDGQQNADLLPLRRAAAIDAAKSSIPEVVVPAGSTYVDTHCHLEEVLQILRKRECVPSLGKVWTELDADELEHWRALGWNRSQWDAGTKTSGDNKKNQTWSLHWRQLSFEQQAAASALGFDGAVVRWSDGVWPTHLPLLEEWDQIDREVRAWLEVLGETAESYDNWTRTPKRSLGAGRDGDLRTWWRLHWTERQAATSLGFTQAVWDLQEMADVHAAVRIFGQGFDGCVIQGIDEYSVPHAKRLALAHPRFFASFGCHPKTAWSYDAAFEELLSSAFDACGDKAVAWGEFGLDYSHAVHGRSPSNRRKQREVFARQVQLAVARGLPMVFHLRNAERDSLRIMRASVPGHWRAHMHSFLGSVHMMQAVLEQWPHFFFGFSGTVSMGAHVEQLVQLCPLERLLLETDAPYLGIYGSGFSHPGHIPMIAEKIAELKNCTVVQVLAAARENSRTMYGI